MPRERELINICREEKAAGRKVLVYSVYSGTRDIISRQMTCLALMAKKIRVSQSTSGDVPESGLNVLNQDGDSIEVALARQLVAA